MRKSRPPADRDKHIYVVDDSEAIVELLREVLGSMGHRMTAVAAAPEHLTQIVRLRPDLAIVELVLDRRDSGWELIRRLKMNHLTAGIPVLACTGAVADIGDKLAWLAESGIVVISKPFELEVFERAVSRALDLPPELGPAVDKRACTGRGCFPS